MYKKQYWHQVGNQNQQNLYSLKIIRNSLEIIMNIWQKKQSYELIIQYWQFQIILLVLKMREPKLSGQPFERERPDFLNTVPNKIGLIPKTCLSILNILFSKYGLFVPTSFKATYPVLYTINKTSHSFTFTSNNINNSFVLFQNPIKVYF